MPYIYLLGSVFLAASSSILGGFFNRKTQQFSIYVLYIVVLGSAVLF